MSKPIFIIATQRSGSNYLRSLLTSTGMFYDFNEILDPYWEGNLKNTYFYFREQEIKKHPEVSIPYPHNVEKLFKDYLAYLEKLQPEHPYHLLDVKYNSLHHFNEIWDGDWPFLFNLINRNQIPFIHLVRNNVYEVYQSLIIADFNKVYTVEKNKSCNLKSISIDLDDMLFHIKLLEYKIDYIRNICKQMPLAMEINYEELVKEKNGIPENIKTEFSKVTGIYLKNNISSPLKKMITKPKELIENYDEVMQCLKNNGYEKYVI